MVASLVYRPSRVVSPSAADPSFRNPGVAERGPSWAAKATEQNPPRWLEVEQVGDIALVRFARRRILTEEAIETSAAQLFGLVENNRQHKLVLNFTNIDRLASAMLGKLILLQKKLQAVDGRVVLCHIAPHLYEIFALLKVPRVLTIYRGETEALEGFRRASSHRWY